MKFKKILLDHGHDALIEYHRQLKNNCNTYPYFNNTNIELLKASYYLDYFDYPNSIVDIIKSQSLIKVKNHRFLKELARYVIFILKDYILATEILLRCVEIHADQPAWVNYFLKRKLNYYTQLTSDICFTSIPKNSSTSIKSIVLSKLLNLEATMPHSKFDNPFFSVSSNPSDYDGLKILVLRDPASRFFSYYGKNIVEEKSLRKEFLYLQATNNDNQVVSFEPSIEEFLENINRYCLIFNDVLHHILPQIAYCPNIDEYDHIVSIESVDDLLEKLIPDYVRKSGKRYMAQKTKKTYSSATITQVQNLYLDDYCHISRIDSHLNINYEPKFPSFLGMQ